MDTAMSVHRQHSCLQLIHFCWPDFLVYLGESWAVYLLLEVVQAAAGVLLVFLVYRVGFVLYRDQALGRLAAILAALYPPFIEMRNEFHSINFYIVLGVTAAVFLERPSSKRLGGTIW